MKAFDFIAPPKVCIEIGQSSLKALDGDDGLELSLERLDNGRLDPLCAERLSDSLRVFLKKHSWRSHIDAVCAINARGVSLRRLAVPACSKEELQRLLVLQIEREFPLAPEELAWGYEPLNSEERPRNGGSATQEVLVSAVKREVLEEYSQVLSRAGLSPTFTLSALVRNALCASPPAQYAILDIGRKQSELISFEDGIPGPIRILSWGGENITSAIERSLGINNADAEKVKLNFADPALSPEQRNRAQSAIAAETEALSKLMQPAWIGHKLYLAGAAARLPEIAQRLASAIPTHPECEAIPVDLAEGRSVAILGLQKLCEADEGASLLEFQLGAAHKAESIAPRVQWQWAAAAVVLLFAALSLRYAEPVLYKGRVTKRLAELKAYRAKIPNVDRELQLLQYLQTNQPSYLDTVYVLATSAPSGTRLDALSVGRPGDISLRATMKDPQQVVDLRSKLIDSGLFSTVVVQEQAPSADKQKLTVRLSAQSRAAADQRPRTMPALAPEPEKPKSSAPAKDVKTIASSATGITSGVSSTAPKLRAPATGSPAPPPDATIGGTSSASPAPPPKE